MRVEVLDPRTDAEPTYWAGLRARAGLRGDWAWEVLAAQAWGSRTPQLVTVLFDGAEAVGVVNAGWLGAPAHRYAFQRAGSRPRLGALHVRGPGTGAVPGWWLADGLPPEVLLGEYGRAMRRELGPGCLATVLRQVTPEQAEALSRPTRVVRPTEPVWTVRTDRWADPEAWLMSLRKSRRSNLRGILKRTRAHAGLEIRVETGSTTVDDRDVVDLMRRNDDKYGGTLVPRLRPLSGYLRALIAQPDVRAQSYLDRETGRVLAFGLVLDHPRWPVFRSWGQRPLDDGGVRDLYFFQMASLVEWAIAEGKRGLALGKGKSREKESLGADPTEQLALAAPIPWW